MRYLRGIVRGIAPAALMAAVFSLAGCNNFFLCDKASCTNNGGGGNTTAGNVAYVSNNPSGSTVISAYSISKGTLTAATNAPFSLPFTPTAMVVSHANGFLYVASTLNSSGAAGLYGFSIGTGGALTSLSGGNPLTAQTAFPIVAMDVSADGNWLFVTTAYDSLTGTGSTVGAYQLNTSTGLPATSATTSVSYISQFGQPQISALKVAPSGQFVSIALGTGGIITFPFTASTGVISQGKIIPANTFDIAVDSNNFLYAAVTGSLNVYSVPSNGVPATSTPVSTQAIGTSAPFSLALDGTSFVYAGASDGTTNLIYAFSTKSGVLAPLSTATIPSPSSTTKMAVDSTGAFLLALGYDASAGLKLYSIGSTGVLTSVDTAGTGTSTTVSSALALTH